MPPVADPRTPTPRVLVVQNSPTSIPGRLVDWLTEAGVDVRVVPGAELPETLDGYHAMVMLGGGFMPDNDAFAPWLADERRLALQALKAEIPMLGICLGAQLLALCAGGEVTESSGETERGSCHIRVLPESSEDAVFAALQPYGTLRMIQNHSDSITTLPPGADLLATNDACRVQAFRVGVAAWGLQFHPEVDATRLRNWDEAALAADGYDHAAMIDAADADAAANEEQSRALIAAFAAVVHDNARDDAAAGGEG